MAGTPPEQRESRSPGIFVAQRAEPLPVEPSPLRQRLVEAIATGAFSAKRFVVGLVEDWRKRDPAFRWKAGIVASWIGISAFSLHVATSGPEDPASNSLGAYVAITHTAMGWGLLLDNQSDRPWEAVEVVVNGEWVHRRERIGPEEKVVLGPFQFQKGDQTPPADLSIDSVRVGTRRGAVSPQLVR